MDGEAKVEFSGTRGSGDAGWRTHLGPDVVAEEVVAIHDCASREESAAETRQARGHQIRNRPLILLRSTLRPQCKEELV